MHQKQSSNRKQLANSYINAVCLYKAAEHKLYSLNACPKVNIKSGKETQI